MTELGGRGCEVRIYLLGLLSSRISLEDAVIVVGCGLVGAGHARKRGILSEEGRNTSSSGNSSTSNNKWCREKLDTMESSRVAGVGQGWSSALRKEGPPTYAILSRNVVLSRFSRFLKGFCGAFNKSQLSFGEPAFGELAFGELAFFFCWWLPLR